VNQTEIAGRSAANVDIEISSSALSDKLQFVVVSRSLKAAAN
jgi:hypothetical protein